MQTVRLAALLALSALLVAGCGGVDQLTPTAAEHSVLRGRARATTAAGPARFRLTIGDRRRRHEDHRRGERTASFARRRAHLYKQIPGGQVPQELVVIGPYTYTNANVQAALADPTVRPWTKLDTRRLTPKQRRDQPDELAHVLAPAYLADGVERATYGGKESDGTMRFSGRGRPDPTRAPRAAARS